MFQRIIFLFVSAFMISPIVFADDAAVLPKGRWRVRLVTSYTEASNEFGPQGDIQSVGNKYSRNLDAQFLQILSPATREVVKALNSMSPGRGDALEAAMLDTKVDSEFFTNLFVAEYGITDRLSVGLILPMVHANINVNAVSKPNNSLNQLLQQPDLPDGHPAKAAMTKLKGALQQIQQGTTVNGLNSTLHDRFGYQSGIDSWSGTGIGDLEVGAKYNYYRAHPLKMTLKAGGRLPTGREDDPDMLTDCAFGDGQFDIGAYHYLDYQPLANTMFTLELGYTMQLPSSTEVRVPLAADVPIGSEKIEVDRKLGDYWEAGLEANQTFFKYVTASAKYRLKQKFSDDYSGASVDLSALEKDTASLLQEGTVQLEYTNLPAVRAGEARFPYALGAFYRQPLAGESVTDVRTTGMFLKTYF
jgi:hypothetical protein